MRVRLTDWTRQRMLELNWQIGPDTKCESWTERLFQLQNIKVIFTYWSRYRINKRKNYKLDKVQSMRGRLKNYFRYRV